MQILGHPNRGRAYNAGTKLTNHKFSSKNSWTGGYYLANFILRKGNIRKFLKRFEIDEEYYAEL